MIFTMFSGMIKYWHYNSVQNMAMAKVLVHINLYYITQKKCQSKKCNNYRTFALVLHASIVMLRILLQRLRSLLYWKIPQKQAGLSVARAQENKSFMFNKLSKRQKNFQNQHIFVSLTKAKHFTEFLR